MIAALVLIIIYLGIGGVYALKVLASTPTLATIPWAVLVVIFFWPYFMTRGGVNK